MINTPSTSISRWSTGLRDAYGDGRITAEQLLERITSRQRAAAALPDRAAQVELALQGAFTGSGVEAKALRSDVELLVDSGDLLPSRAEALAQLFAWEQFAGWADPGDYDPMAEGMWSLSMAAAWISRVKDREPSDFWLDDEHGRQETESWPERDYERVIDHVRRHWPAYIVASIRWLAISHSAVPSEDAPHTAGYVIAPRENRGWSPPPDKSCDAKQTLLGALKSGSLIAKRYIDGTLTPIEPAEWSILKIAGFHGDDGVHRVFAPDASEYLSVCITRKHLEKLFPLSPNQDGPQALKPITPALAQKLLKEFVEREGSIPGQLAAEEYFQGLGYRGRGNIRAAVSDLTGGRGRGSPKQRKAGKT